MTTNRSADASKVLEFSSHCLFFVCVYCDCLLFDYFFFLFNNQVEGVNQPPPTPGADDQVRGGNKVMFGIVIHCS